MKCDAVGRTPVVKEIGKGVEGVIFAATIAPDFARAFAGSPAGQTVHLGVEDVTVAGKVTIRRVVDTSTGKMQVKPCIREHLVDGKEMERMFFEFMWWLLAEHGLSCHTLCPYGVMGLRGLRGSTRTISALALECLTGFRGNISVTNMAELIHAIATGAIVCDEDVASAFRILVFQTVYTVYQYGAITNGDVRHNDLHAANVGITSWNPANTAVSLDAEYVVYKFDSTRNRVPVRYRFKARDRAVILDTGQLIALMPGVPGTPGMPADPRFTSTVYKNAGILTQACYRYDSTLFMSSLAHTIVHKWASLLAANRDVSRPAPPMPDIFHEFLGMYTRLYGALAEEEEYMCNDGKVFGRLTMTAQEWLLKHPKKVRLPAVPGSKNTAPCMVPAPLKILQDVFFKQLRLCEGGGCDDRDAADVSDGTRVDDGVADISGHGRGGAVRGKDEARAAALHTPVPGAVWLSLSGMQLNSVRKSDENTGVVHVASHDVSLPHAATTPQCVFGEAIADNVQGTPGVLSACGSSSAGAMWEGYSLQALQKYFDARYKSWMHMPVLDRENDSSVSTRLNDGAPTPTTTASAGGNAPSMDMTDDTTMYHGREAGPVLFSRTAVGLDTPSIGVTQQHGIDKDTVAVSPIVCPRVVAYVTSP